MFFVWLFFLCVCVFFLHIISFYLEEQFILNWMFYCFVFTTNSISASEIESKHYAYFKLQYKYISRDKVYVKLLINHGEDNQL